jgi:drug/metabolite transporter (DMT)-like permease
MSVGSVESRGAATAAGGAREGDASVFKDAIILSAMAAPRRTSPYLLLTLTPFFWACNWILGRALHADIPPMAMTFFRWLFAILILAPFAWPHVKRDWPVIRANWKVLLVLGAIGIGTHNGLAYLGLNFTTATNGVILNSFIPIMIVTLSWVFLREPLTPLQTLGVAVSFGGVLAILTEGSFAKLAAFRLNIGDILVILSMAMWSIYTIGLRWRPAGLHVMSFLLVVAIIGNACVLPLWLGEMALGYYVHWSWTNLAALLSVALFSSVLAYLFWNRGVAEVGANVAGLFVHLMPVFGVLLAWLLLGESLAPYHVAGIAFILVGIWLTSRYGRRRPDIDEAAAVGTD